MSGKASVESPGTTRRGFVTVNADDWGRDVLTTDRILECSNRGAVSSVSAMVFMEDSARAAALAREHGVEAGLHVNLTTSFSAPNGTAALLEHQQAVAGHLLRHRFAQAVFHPGLVRSFEYLVRTQVDEFRRLYGTDPERLDGHHHMHLCSNVLLQRLLAEGTIVRRSFSFERGEKAWWNRLYRNCVDSSLAKRHRLTDYFFSLIPLEPAGRLRRIYSLARDFSVELETHPVNGLEYAYLTQGEFFRQIGDVRIAPPSPYLRGSARERESGL